jgi:hypothetical protein
MLKLHTLKQGYTQKEVKEMGWKNSEEFCHDLGIDKITMSKIMWPGEPISITCSKQTQKELLSPTSKKTIAVHFIVHGRLYWEKVIAYELGDCLVITDKEFEKLF